MVASLCSIFLNDSKISKCGYAESSSSTLNTTKCTKDAKKECPINLHFLRDLRVLRGEITADGIQLELFR